MDSTGHQRTGYAAGLRSLVVAGFLLAFPISDALRADSIAVRHAEGVVRGFLVLRSLDGALLANGDLIQFSRGDRVTSRLIFRFRDGSTQDETAVFSQRRQFQLVSDHLVQRGPSFPRPMDVSIDAPGGRVTVRYRDGDKEKFLDERMELPSDLANGMTLTLLKNLDPAAPSTTVTMIVATPKPRLVQLVITRAGEDSFSVGGRHLAATRFNLKIEIGGLAGVVARLIGKQPKDASVWILGGDAPGFMESESQFYDGAPLWRIELAAPSPSVAFAPLRFAPAPATEGSSLPPVGRLLPSRAYVSFRRTAGTAGGSYPRTDD